MLSIKQKASGIDYSVLVFSLVAFCLAGCGTTHQTYLYHGPNSFDTDQYAGSALSIQWQAQPGQVVMDSAPTPIVLEVTLIGPFQHIDDVLNAIRKHKNDSVLAHMGPILATSPALRTDNWTNKTLTSTISFPSTLQSGYYTLVLTVNGDPATRAYGIIRIHAVS